MKLYKISADCLVEEFLIQREIKAENEYDAFEKAFNIFSDMYVADCGTIDVEEIGEIKNDRTRLH